MELALCLKASLYLYSIITFQFIATPLLSQLTYWNTLNKNLTFIKENQHILIDHPIRSYRYQYFLGSFFIILILVGITLALPNLMLVVHICSAVISLLHIILIEGKNCNNLSMLIPSPSQRTAFLTLRKVSFYIPSFIYKFSWLLTTLLFTLVGLLLLNKLLTIALIQDHLKFSLVLTLFFQVAIFYEARFSKTVLFQPEIANFQRKITIQMLLIILLTILAMAYYQLISLLIFPNFPYSISITGILAGNFMLTAFIIYIYRITQQSRAYFKSI